MSNVKIAFKQLTVPDKIQKANTIVQAMDGNEHFPSPIPSLTEVKECIQKVEDAYTEAYYGGKDRRGKVAYRVDELDTQIVALGGYVQAVSKGDELIILSSGFEVKDLPSASRPVDKPDAPIVKPGRKPGEVYLRWKKVHGATTYIMNVSHDNGESWQDAGISSRLSNFVSGLPAGSRPLVRIAAHNSLGPSDWSEVGIGNAGS